MDSTGPLAIFFAATYPVRTAALVLFGTLRVRPAGRGVPVGLDRRGVGHDREVEEGWGSPTTWSRSWSTSAQRRVRDPEAIARWTSYYCQAASPGMAVALNRLERETDVRPVLRTVQAPTLVLHRKDESVYQVDEAAIWLATSRGRASSSSTARTTSPGTATWGGASRRSVGSSARYGTRRRRSIGCSHPSSSRTSWIDREVCRAGRPAMAETVEDTTPRSGRSWRDITGSEIDTAGDGFFATFDGPARAVRCAQAIVEAVCPLGLEVRAGVHTGRSRRSTGRSVGSP